MRIIVAGISTEVGKTVVSAILATALGYSYWKPVQCGLPRDTDWIKEHATLKQEPFEEAFFLKTPCSPHKAAEIENVSISAQIVQIPLSENIIIEGAGGIMAPLNEHECWIDAAVRWNASWVIVHRHYLGSLNHFYLTLEALKNRQQKVLGIVFNGPGDMSTEQMLLDRTKTKCIGRLPWMHALNQKDIQKIAAQWHPGLLQMIGHAAV